MSRMEKKYDNAYLERLAGLVKPIKERSYDFLMDLPPGATVLDLGCGTGIDCRQIRNAIPALEIIGIDHDPVALHEAKEKSDGTIRYILADGDDLPIETESIDVVRSERVFQHLTNPEKVMDGVSRVLRTGGKAIILETDWASMSFGSDMMAAERKLIDEKLYNDICNGLASRTLSGLLHGAGLEMEAIEVWPTTVRTLQDATYVTGLDRDAAALTIREHDLSTFMAHLKKLDQENRFVFSWNTYLYVAKKR